jgi:lysophospholipase L1-like esterase
MLKSLATLALAPILIAQGRAVRRRALRLPEAAGARTGLQGRGSRLGLLVLGDSAAAGVGAETQDEALVGQLRDRLARHHRVDWRLVAKSGQTSAEVLEALESLDGFEVDCAVTSVGVNDVVARTPRARFRRNMAAIISALRARGANRIVLSGLPPMGRFPLLPQPLRAVLGAGAVALDADLAALAKEAGVVHLAFDFQAGLGPEHMAVDGFHPGPAIYAAWADAVASVFLETAPADTRAGAAA